MANETEVMLESSGLNIHVLCQFVTLLTVSVLNASIKSRNYFAFQSIIWIYPVTY